MTNVNLESMKHHSMLLTTEYGIPYDDSWTLIESICNDNGLDMQYNTNIIWATLQAENQLRKEYGRPYYWK